MRRRVLVFLFGVAAAQVGLDAAFFAVDAGVQTTDAAYHLSRVVATRRAWDGIEADAAFDGQRYGGLVYALAATLSYVVGLDPERLLLALAVALRPLLLVGAYRIGAALAPRGQEETAGVLAALVLALTPGATNYGRVLVLDLPLAAALAWATAGALEWTAGRGPRRGAALRMLGGATAALFVKLNALAFLVGPAAVVLWPALRGDSRRRRVAILGGAGLAALLAAVVARALLSGPRGPALRRTLEEGTWPGAVWFGYRVEGSLAEAPGDWWRYVLDQAWEATYFTTLQTLTPPLVLVGAGAVAVFFARRRGCVDNGARRQRAMLFLHAAVPILGVVALLRGLYDERYLLPLLPPLAGIVGCVVAELRPGVPRRALVAALLGGLGLNAAYVHGGALPASRPLFCGFVDGWATSRRVDRRLWLCLAYPDYRFMDRPTLPRPDVAPTAAVAAALEPLRARAGRPLRAVFLDDLYELFYASFQRSLLEDRPLFRHEDVLLVTECWNEAWMNSVFESPRAVEATIRAADVVLMRYGAPDEKGDDAVRGRRCEVFWDQAAWFGEAGEVYLPDGTSVKAFAARPLLGG